MGFNWCSLLPNLLVSAATQYDNPASLVVNSCFLLGLVLFLIHILLNSILAMYPVTSVVSWSDIKCLISDVHYTVTVHKSSQLHRKGDCSGKLPR